MEPTKLTGYLDELLMTSMSLAAVESYLGPPEIIAMVEKCRVIIRVYNIKMI